MVDTRLRDERSMKWMSTIYEVSMITPFLGPCCELFSYVLLTNRKHCWI